MSKISYNIEEVGKQILGRRNKITRVRKYHLTEEEKTRLRKRWKADIKEVRKEIKEKAGKHFFNPYRRGIYYYQIKTLFLLGANEWHSFFKILQKIEKIMRKDFYKNGENVWLKFRGKLSREESIINKDYKGRIQENMLFFQKLSKRHPTGYKLHQVFAAVDIKRVSTEKLLNGLYFYRLSTYDTIEEAYPIRDYKEFKFSKGETKFINKKFIGTTIAPNKIIKLGVEYDLS